MADHLRKIGFFGGTFDPIHFGHINLALEILETFKLDEVLFSPANFSPEKENSKPKTPGHHRKAMIELAIEDIPRFSMTDIELIRQGPSFTIETIRTLLNKSKDVQYYLILGEDMIKGLPHWKEIQELVELAPPIIGTRLKHPHEELPEDLEKVIQENMCEIPLFEISSTWLRKRLNKGLYCGHLIPLNVNKYIEENNLYGKARK